MAQAGLLRSMGFFGTPTVIHGKHALFGAVSLRELERFLGVGAELMHADSLSGS
jgi:hypothetical protein